MDSSPLAVASGPPPAALHLRLRPQLVENDGAVRTRLLALSLVSAGCSLLEVPDLTSGLDGGCPIAARSCPATFTLRDGRETTVELRGSFRAGAWTQGVPMVRTGGRWVAQVPVPYGVEVQYKFFVDGTTWLLDPGNPRTARDTAGTLNNVRPADSCADALCGS